MRERRQHRFIKRLRSPDHGRLEDGHDRVPVPALRPLRPRARGRLYHLILGQPREDGRQVGRNGALDHRQLRQCGLAVELGHDGCVRTIRNEPSHELL